MNVIKSEKGDGEPVAETVYKIVSSAAETQYSANETLKVTTIC